MEYYDGMGSYHDREWNMKYDFENEHYSLPSSEFGVTPKYTMNDTLYNFLHFNFDPNKDKYQQMMNELKNKWEYERKKICIEYIGKESVLSYAFLYYV